MSTVQAKLETASQEYQKLQIDLANIVSAGQKLEAQKSENELVKKGWHFSAEFASLKPENTVYKQIGPVLVKQDQAEAKGNVDTRLEFIQSEIKRVEGQIQAVQNKIEDKKKEIVSLQTTLQQQQSASASA